MNRMSDHPKTQVAAIQIFLNIGNLENELALDTRSNMTLTCGTNFIYAITNEKTVTQIQLYTLGSTVTTDPALIGSNNSCEHTLLSPYTLYK